MSYESRGDPAASASVAATRGRPLAGVPVWERPQFIHTTAGPMPGLSLGPRYPGAPAPGPTQRTVCVEPTWDPDRGGLQVHREWPPPVGPRERSLQMQGCRPTGQRCGHGVYGGQYWTCPAGPAPGGGGMGPFIGTPFARADTPLDGFRVAGHPGGGRRAIGPDGNLAGDLRPPVTVMGIAVAAAMTIAFGVLAMATIVPAAAWTAHRLGGEIGLEEARTVPYGR